MPVSNPTRDDIIRTLETLRNKTEQRQTYLRPQQYRNFMPETPLNYRVPEQGQWESNLQGIERLGDNATELSLVIAQNKAAMEAKKRAAKQKKRSEQQLAAAANAAATNSSNATSSGGGTTPGSIKGFDINAPLRTYNWRGFSLTLNSSVARRFTGFLEALWKKGYHPVSIGSYSKRNIAGTNTPSLHSRGLAIDIDPGKNPVTWNGQNVTALPPGVGALAARYGLKWGGAWLGSKRDPMHFSVPYGGVM